MCKRSHHNWNPYMVHGLFKCFAPLIRTSVYEWKVYFSANKLSCWFFLTLSNLSYQYRVHGFGQFFLPSQNERLPDEEAKWRKTTARWTMCRFSEKLRDLVQNSSLTEYCCCVLLLLLNGIESMLNEFQLPKIAKDHRNLSSMGNNTNVNRDM